MRTVQVFYRAVRQSCHHVLQLLLMVLVLVLSQTSAFAGQASGAEASIPDGVIGAAQAGLMPLLEVIPSQDLVQYGLQNVSDIREISLGTAYRVFTLDFEAPAGRQVETLVHMIKPTSMWFFQVVHDGRPCCLLTVDLVHGEYRAVAIGSAGLAGELFRVEEEYPAELGYSKVFVRVFQATSDLLLLNREGMRDGVVGLRSARMSLGLKEQDSDIHALWEPNVILSRLTSVINESVEPGVGR